MNLTQQDFLFLDCQTTGMHPSTGHLLEMSWAYGNTAQSSFPEITSRLVKLPNNESIPKDIQKITGLTDEDLKQGLTQDELFQEFQQRLAELPGDTKILIHYAQFENAFLKDLFKKFAPDEALPEIICTSKISRKVFPNLTSGNIRAVCGYLGSSVCGSLKRASSHVQATMEIWKELSQELAQKEIITFEQLQTFLGEKKVKDPIAKYEYRLDRLLRLSLPNEPGIYKMYNKKNEILYVGKATSLKSRVNSYFRGQKKRDKKTMELIAQVWNIETITCSSPLEAALMETDEIKRLNPPYNISLKADRAPSFFTTKDFLSVWSEQNEEHPQGPFRPFGALEHTRILRRGLLEEKIYQVFYIEIPSDVLREGLNQFCEKYKFSVQDLTDLRKMMAFGLNEYRKHLSIDPIETQEEVVADSEAAEIEEEITAEEVADKFYRLYMRAGHEYHRSCQLNRLINCKVRWQYKNKWHELTFKEGHLESNDSGPWTGWDAANYDRMSVLLSELSKHDYSLEPLR